LTFIPPDPPYYELVEAQDESGEIQWLLDPLVAGSAFPHVEISILKTEKGSFIPAFLFRHPDATLTLIFSHGNAADCGAMRERYIQLCRRGRVNVFAYDYTGYGAASGKPSEAHTYTDIEAAYDHLVSRNICSHPEQQIVLYGQSVGSGPSCKLASSKSRPIRGMILHSPILSGIRVLVENRGPLACCDIYPNIDRIQSVNAPVLIIHGDQDQEVGFHHGERLHKAIPEMHRKDPCFVSGAGHNDIVEEFGDEYYPAVISFLRELEQLNERPGSEPHVSSLSIGPGDQLVVQ